MGRSGQCIREDLRCHRQVRLYGIRRRPAWLLELCVSGWRLHPERGQDQGGLYPACHRKGNEVLHWSPAERLVPEPDLLCRDRSRHCLLLREGRNVPGRRLEHPCRAAELPRNGGQVGCGGSAQVPRPGKRRRSCDHLQRSVLRDCCQQQESGYREGYPEVLRQRGGPAHSGRKRCSHPCLSGSGGYLGRLLCRVSHQYPVLH